MKSAFTFLLTGTLILCLLGCAAKKTSAETAPSPPPPVQTVPAASVPETTEALELPTEETAKEDPIMETQPQLLVNPDDSDFVRVRDYVPGVLEELIYATDNNFTGSVIYGFQDVYLRYGTVKKLAAVQEELRTMGLGLKIWDGFRPVSAQFKLWEIYPDDTYVANPNLGFSNHSRGNAVDLTLVDLNGIPLEMPTEFDDFSGRADRNYAEIPQQASANSKLLETVMEKHGFKGYYGEWWHYNDTVRYEPERFFDPGVISPWVVTEETQLLSQSSAVSQVLYSLPAGEVVQVLGYDGEYALAQYAGVRGYVLCIRLFPA